MQIIKKNEIPVFTNSGVESEQIVFPELSPDAKSTITRVTVPVSAVNPRHAHDASEQIWIILSGEGTLLLDAGSEQAIGSGDVARFAPGDVHGFRNTGNQPFVYISVTTPPQNFREAYTKDWGN